MTNERRIKAMSTEELAEYLYDRGNGSEYCYGICAYQYECFGMAHGEKFCIEQICKWLEMESEE
jgi:hypothetical protein